MFNSAVMESECKILDCTLRDGGLVTDSRFSVEFARGVLSACDAAGVDIVEIGFRNDDKFFARNAFGAFRFCDEDFIKPLVEGVRAKIAVLADAGKCDARKFPNCSESAVDLVRCAFYARDISAALETLSIAKQKGYETAACMMAASSIGAELRGNVRRIAESDAVDIVYLMDSYGALLPRQFSAIAREYAEICAECGKTFGVHAHNNLQCALANELAGIDAGARVADCTIGGLGKGAGNCPSELLVSVLRGAKNALPIIDFCQKQVEPIKTQFHCGQFPQYMLTAAENLHPRPAMDFFKNGDTRDIFAFYDGLKRL